MTGVPVIDLFAGPGGLCEGFASLTSTQSPGFDIRLSIEKDAIAHKTLALRALFRSFRHGKVPEAYYRYVRGEISRVQLEQDPQIIPNLKRAYSEARCAELGKNNHREIDGWIREALAGTKDWVLIGGPPCQAYSLAGRSRMRAKDPHAFESDERHFLYREYLRIIKAFAPSVFIMENVKGMLNSKHAGSYIFNQIIKDLRAPGNGLHYVVRSLAVPGEIQNPADFVIKAEEFGVPQKRHRVILFGIRADIANSVPDLAKRPGAFTLKREPGEAVCEILDGLPALRSKLSTRYRGGSETFKNWHKTVCEGLSVIEKKRNGISTPIVERIERAVVLAQHHKSGGGAFIPKKVSMKSPNAKWFLDPRIGGVTLHETRSHMASDLHRYLFASAFAWVEGRSPKLRDFPIALLPSHGNVDAELPPFVDRFRVQLRDQPSSTVVSHISKDGHYYIHPDPSQCRSLTVREAARLQTFPDNYFFEGNRTQQYHQVGNAVPPLLARNIARIVLRLLRSARL